MDVTEQSVFHDRSEHQPVPYQTLAPLAALAFVLGMLSLFAFAAPLLLIVPAAAIGAALLALRKIHSSDGALSGERLACWGLALGLACGIAVFVRDPVRNALIRRQVDAISQQWLMLLADGRFEEATKLLDAEALQGLVPRPDERAKPMSKEEALAIAIEHLRRDKLVQRLAALGSPVHLVPDDSATPQPVFDGDRTLIGVRRTVAGTRAGEPCHVDFGFLRLPVYETEGRPWRIQRWALVDSPPSGESPSSPTSAQ